MTARKYIIFYIVIAILILMVLLLARCQRAHEDFTASALANIPQNAFVFLNATTEKKLILPNASQKNYAEQYLQHYFSPWSTNFFAYSPTIKNPIKSFADIKQFEMMFIAQFLEDPGYGINRLKNSNAWIEKNIANMNMATFPNQQGKAITLAATNLRELPTNDFAFDNWDKAGEGYPFDYMQESYVPANTPALVLQVSKDGAWYLILINNDIGWMQSQNVSFVNDKFIKEWQTGRYIAPLTDHVEIYDSHHLFRFSGDIGSLYPLAKQQRKNKNDYQILIAVPDSNEHPVIKLATIKSSEVALWPLPATPANFAYIINKMLGTYYGWGGMRGYRDCSATTMNLFATFGIWLPRNSTDQALSGNFIPLENLSAKKKARKITQEALPFLTLLKLPGHIVVYIGSKNGNDFIFHDFWGVHTKNLFGQEGRAIVGKSAITSLYLGAGYTNVPQRFVDLVQGMTVFD